MLLHILSREGNIGMRRKILVRKDSYDAPDTLEHFHDFLEIVYIVSENATHIVNGEDRAARIGDLYLLDFSDKHHFGIKMMPLQLSPAPLRRMQSMTRWLSRTMRAIFCSFCSFILFF